MTLVIYKPSRKHTPKTPYFYNVRPMKQYADFVTILLETLR